MTFVKSGLSIILSCIMCLSLVLSPGMTLFAYADENGESDIVSESNGEIGEIPVPGDEGEKLAEPGGEDSKALGIESLVSANQMTLGSVATVEEGATVKADPDSPTGYTVTFVYKNENATSVKLAGDLTMRDVADPLNPVQRYQPETYVPGRYHTGGTEFTRAMTKDENGYWSVSIPMHAGGLSYWYRVDDPSQDWSNKRIWDPTASHPRPEDSGSVTTYRTVHNDVLGAVYVPYDEKQNNPLLESRAKYELPAEVQGTVTYVPYTPWTPEEYPDLRQPGEDYYLGVYLPPDYDEDRAEPYPVVYLNHGVYGDETDWMVPGNAPNIIDNLIAEGEIEPTVLVTVGNHFSTVPGPGTGMPENGYNPPTAARNIVEAVMPFMEKNYNVSDKASGRAVGGFSYGGSTTWNVMYEYADLFGYFGLFSAAGSLSTAQLDNIKAKAAGETRVVMIGNGIFEGALSNSGRDSLRSIGFKSETHQVPGAHDMMTAGQLFTIFAKDYLWEEKEQSADGAKSVRPITEVRWWGQQVGGVVLEFAENVDASALTAADFGIQDTAYNTSFDPSSVAGSRAMLVDQPIKDVFTVADPSLLLKNERPEAPGRYLVVTVDLDKTWFGRSILLHGMMGVKLNTNPPTEITIKKNIYSAGGTLLAKAGETPLAMTDVPVVNRGYDEYTQDVFNPTVGTELNYSYRLPDNYDPAKEYPLVVYLTGMGQGYILNAGAGNIGVNIATEASSQFWFSDEFKEKIGKDVIFLAPQSTRSLSVAVQAEQVAELIEDFSKEYAVDTGRVYFYTLSYGGRLGWWLAANRPDLFAAVMPTSFDQLTAAQAAAIAEAELPVCMIAGKNDHLMTYPMTTAQRDLLLTAYRDRGVSEDRIAELVKWYEFDHEDFDRVGVPCPVEWVGTDNHYMAGYPGAYNVDNPRSRRDQHISLIPALRDNPKITEWLLAQVKAPEFTEGVTVTKDSDSPTGYTVTFAYKNDSATRVEMVSPHMRFMKTGSTGSGATAYYPVDSEGNVTWTRDMYLVGNDSAPFRIDMKKIGNDLWTVSFPLPSGSYSYQYRLNGSTLVEDPANPGMHPPAPHAADPHSLLGVPFDPEKQDYDFSFGAPLPGVPQGTVEFLTYQYNGPGTTSPTKHVAVYLPPNHDKNRAEPYKVQIVSHGMGGWETEWMHKGKIPVLMNNMIATGEIEPYVVVSVNNTQFNFTSGDNTASVIDATLNYLMPILVEKYNVSTNPKDRAYSGYSYGGHITSRVLRDAPKQFGYFGMWSGADQNVTVATWRNNVTSLPEKDKPVVMYSMGVNDQMRGAFGGDQFRNRLNEAGVEFADYSDWPGGHDWMFWHRSFYVFATKYLWKEKMVEGATVTEDPESPTGYTVTFVYKNENATRVQLAGDLGLVDLDDVTPTSAPNTLPRYQPEDWKTGRYSVGGVEWRRDMVNDGNGYWSVTVPLHAGGLSYWYRVSDPVNYPNLMINEAGTSGGLRIWDPASKHPRPPVGFSWRETRNDVLDVVYVPYDPKLNDPTLESRATYQLPRTNPAESGSVKYVPYTANNGSTAYLGIYLPAGYDPNRAEPYKVMYLGHGGGGDETDWMIPGNAPYVMDNAIARGEIEPTILVSMGYSFLPGGMAGATDNMINRILPYMEDNYNVSKETEGRAYGGFSNGASYGDMLLEEYTETFGYFGYFSTVGAKNLNFSKIASAKKVPFVHVGNGIFESAAYKSNMSGFYANLQKAGIPSAYYQFEGAHDMMTASQQFTTFVKNHLWKLVMKEGATVKADPESPTGYTVTFVYKNENATSVQLAGDLTLRDDTDPPTEYPTAGTRYQPEEWRTGRYHTGGTEFTRAMTNVGDGYWTVSIPLHAGGLSYWYRVHGDPSVYTGTAATVPAAGARIWDPTSDHPRPEFIDPSYQANRTRANDVLDAVYVPYDEKQNDPYLARRAVYELPAEVRGTVHYDQFTNIMDAKAYLGIYLPPGYDENRAEPYPVVYLIHGGGGDETDWMISGNTPNIIDNMVARGELEPTVVVTMSNAGISGNAVSLSGVSSSRQAINIVDVILPYMEENYNVSDKREGRAIGGFSMGSMLTHTVLRAFVNTFGYYACFSGNTAFNDAQIASLKAEAGDNLPFILMANGKYEGQVTAHTNNLNMLVGAGIPAVYEQVPGNHDMMTCSQNFTTFAKNYLWKPVMKEGATVNADPESPTGYTVTFVYKNENATSVKLAGDLTMRDVSDTGTKWYQPEEWKTGRYHVGGTEFTRAMTNVGNGYWTVTIPMHAGGLSYWYRVDDPSQGWTNKRIWDPTASHPRPPAGNSYRETRNDVLGAVYVPYDEKQNDPTLEIRATYELPREDQAERGSVAYVPYTNINGVTDYLGVYLPAGYDKNREEPYKVMYLSHGIYGDETDWMVPGNAPNIIDNMVARGEIEPTILVTTGNHLKPNWSYNTTTAANNIATVVIPFMETNYNVSTERSGRAYGGFSMGGMTGGPMMNLHADKFAYYGFFSGSPSGPNYNTIAGLTGGKRTFVMLGNGSFEGALTSFNTVRDNLRNVGIASETHQVPGAHDMMTAGQLFTTFAKNYLWKFKPADKTELNALIAEAEEKVQIDYTVESWTEFSLALSRAKLVSANDDAAQDDVDAAVEALQKAMNDLKEFIDVTSVKIDGAAIQQVRMRNTKQFTATINPTDASDKTIKWTSSNEKIFTVDQNGLVTGLATGSAKLIVTASNGVTSFIMVQITA